LPVLLHVTLYGHVTAINVTSPMPNDRATISDRTTAEFRWDVLLF